jgi:hypothetical protein
MNLFPCRGVRLFPGSTLPECRGLIAEFKEGDQAKNPDPCFNAGLIGALRGDPRSNPVGRSGRDHEATPTDRQTTIEMILTLN